MSAPEPTAEHLRLAREALPANATPGQVNRIARALAAAEARGFEKATDAAITHTMAIEAQNVALLRWQSVASDAHVGHICALIRSLAVSDETPRTLRDLSAMGVEEEVRRIVAAERINREKSEVSVREWRKKAENAEADALDAEARGFERGKESAAKVADSVMHDTQMPWYVTKNNIVHAIRAFKEPR